ncbi:MAG TPA: cytochrome c oxidase subunit II [Bryobacteraceae bacterium]
MLKHALIAFLQTNVPGLPEHRVANIFKPLASPGASEKEIALLTFAITGAIFVVVAGLIVYTMWRFRRKAGDDEHQEPPQVYGSNQIEIAWTVIPILIVFVLIGVSARVIASVENASPPPATAKVTLVGHQWWWEVDYPQFNVRTANEIHVPVSRNGNHATYLTLESVDVIHSFWAPQLAGKMDLIPNRQNFTWIDPSEPGVYFGNCAEYCGTQHANMLLRVIAQEPDDFKSWAVTEAKPAVDDPSVASGKAMYQSLSCVNCHTIRGTSSIGQFGPDLTHLMSRQTIGAGMLTNTPEHLRAWVNDPQVIKPGCLMPSMNLTDRELNQVVGYLETLR